MFRERIARPAFINSTFISSTEIQAPNISGTTGYFSGNLSVGASGTMKFGVDVSGSNDGLYINANNYLYNTGDFKLGTATDYITLSGSTFTLNSSRLNVVTTGTNKIRLDSTAATPIFAMGATLPTA
jgi:allophanate hydrolase subunit 2